MSNYALSRLERLYLQTETTYGQIPNSGGTASVAGANACRHIKATFDNDVALIERPDKTGTRTMQVGVAGRKFAQWSAEMSIAPNGVAGTAPDMDPLMQMIFGQAGTATSGTATITAASNASPIVCSATNTFANNDVVFITGVTGNTAANGVWLLSTVSGSAFTLVGSTGNSAYVSGGTASRVGYRYALSDNIISGCLWSFRQPASIEQRATFGAVATRAQFQLGQDVARCSFSGDALWSLQSDQYSVADVIQKGGISAFPTEPGSPVTNGGIIAGFTGSVSVAGANIATLRTATIDFNTQNQLVKDTFGTYYPSSVQGDERNVGITFSLYEDDSTAFQNITAAANARTPVQIPLFMGTASGSIFGIVLNNVQLATPKREENIRYIANFSGSTAHGSSLTARDEAFCVLI